MQSEDAGPPTLVSDQGCCHKHCAASRFRSISCSAVPVRSCEGCCREQADEFAEKLDSLMEVVLEHLEAGVGQRQGPALWSALLPVFQRTIMRAHRCKFAQYLLWYLCLKVRLPAYLPGCCSWLQNAACSHQQK